MNQVTSNFRNRDYWIVENAQYARANFRIQKCARMVNRMAGNSECALLDVGCGPSALQPLLNHNVHYYGMDMAIHSPAENLIEVDIARAPIAFKDKSFDFVVAMGFFEYMGERQEDKFKQIDCILKPNGKFIMSYVNFGHARKLVWPNYNNVMPIADMAKSLERVFRLERCTPVSHHWRQKQLGKYSAKTLQMHLNMNIPILSPLFAVEYFFVCSRRIQS